ncbi:aminotransferase [Rhizosaccharibacter radicis]|uniref:Aminotransferase n=1 Tax=Rhizosaccharibacter radicis TaxID=2782605 RepID=A0ABT1VWZ5_9PROT|nr:aminotransferase [Acetobacteraceae bacterium KSS12]
MKPLNSLLAATPTTIFTVITALAQKHGAVNLGQGFPDTEGPADIVQAASDALHDNRNQYAPLTGLPELREAVARGNKRFFGLDIDPATGVVVTSGATEALAASLAALLDPGDEVVLIEPLYDTYLPTVRLLGAVPRLVRLLPPERPEEGWRLPREALRAAFGPRTKLLLLNSPMNPIGKLFDAEELAFIAGLLREHDCYAVCDEVYEHLVFDGARHVPLMTLPGMRERCVRIGSAGKSFSLTGWKVGYVSAPAPLAAAIAKAHQNLVFATAPNLQRAVAFGLDKDAGYFQELADDLQRKRDLLSDGLRRLGFGVLPSGGSYFVVADLRPLGTELDDDGFCRLMTREAGVAAIPVSAFYGSPDAPRHLVRFAFCKREAVLRDALARLEAAMPRLRAAAVEAAVAD